MTDIGSGGTEPAHLGPSEASRKCSPRLTLYIWASTTIKHRTLSGIEGAEKQYISDETQEVKIDFLVLKRKHEAWGPPEEDPAQQTAFLRHLTATSASLHDPFCMASFCRCPFEGDNAIYPVRPSPELSLISFPPTS